MGKYQGAVCRHSRREGVKLFLKGEKCFTKCTLAGVACARHAHAGATSKISDYGIQLCAKQRARRIYLLEAVSTLLRSRREDGRRHWLESPASARTPAR